MTTVSERVLAVLSTRELLHELAAGEFSGVQQEALRGRAEALLRHYPEAEQLPTLGEPHTCGAGDRLSIAPSKAQQRPQPVVRRNGRTGFARPRAYPTEDECVQTVVVACLPELDLVWVRDDQSRQYSLDPETKGVSLIDLRQGQVIECDLAVNGAETPKVTAARIVARRYPKDEGQL